MELGLGKDALSSAAVYWYSRAEVHVVRSLDCSVALENVLRATMIFLTVVAVSVRFVRNNSVCTWIAKQALALGLGPILTDIIDIIIL